MADTLQLHEYKAIQVWPLNQHTGIQCLSEACLSRYFCTQHFMNQLSLSPELRTPNIMWDTNNIVYCSQTLSDTNHGRLTRTFDGLKCI